jgi:hypothetical protein
MSFNLNGKLVFFGLSHSVMVLVAALRRRAAPSGRAMQPSSGASP